MVKELGQMVTNMKESMYMVKLWERVNLFTQMEICIKVILKVIEPMDMEHLYKN